MTLRHGLCPTISCHVFYATETPVTLTASAIFSTERPFPHKLLGVRRPAYARREQWTGRSGNLREERRRREQKQQRDDEHKPGSEQRHPERKKEIPEAVCDIERMQQEKFGAGLTDLSYTATIVPANTDRAIQNMLHFL